MSTDLRDAVKRAATDRVWSQGSLLAREDRVTYVRSDNNETEFEVRLPTRPVPFTVHLSDRHAEWECDCSSRDAVCAHVAAAVIVWADGNVPTAAGRGGGIGYRLQPAPGGIEIRRVVVGPTGENAIGASGLPPDARPTDVDVRLDPVLRKTPIVTADRYADILRALSEAADVQWRGAPIRVDAEPVWPRMRLVDDGDFIVLITETMLAKEDCVAAGLCLMDNVLRPLGAIERTGLRLELLPTQQRFSSREWARLPTIIAELRTTFPINIETQRLPRSTQAQKPRIALEIDEAGDKLALLPLLVYGDPPVARIDGGAITMLEAGAPAPVRDHGAEKQLLLRLRDELNAVPGRRIHVAGEDARELSRKLARWLRSDAAAAQHAVPLRPVVSVDGTRLVAAFHVADGRVVPAATVLRAWQSEAPVVPLPGGGWGRVPTDWLSQHGHRLAELLSARAGERVPMYLMPDVGRLCEALALPPPPELARLRPLMTGGVPRVAIPDGVLAELRPYQHAGVDWLAFCRDAGLGAILADDMGLGKTLQAICAIAGPTIVIAPTSVLFNWRAELAKFRPSLRVHTYHGPRRTLPAPGQADVVLTSYALLRSDVEKLNTLSWDLAILDEAHAIKNPDSQVARAAYALSAQWRLSMTGTPIENRLDELWSQFHFTNPGFFGSRHEFLEAWETRVASGDAEAAAELRARIRPFVMRRKKSEVAPELPPRTEAVQYIELSDDERARYNAVRAATQAELVDVYERGGVMAALEALLRLRQASCHGALLPGAIVTSSTKVEVLLEMVSTLLADGHKALIFSQWTSLLDLIEPPLKRSNIRFGRLDGSTRDRGAVVTNFQADDGPSVLLLSLKAGGVGLNLTAADHVFLCDPWWNPAVEDQAADRAHRIGQDKPVTIYRLVARDTVEEKVMELQARKRALVGAALDGGMAQGITREELLALLD